MIPKITDFGLAKFLDAGPGPTGSDGFLGTPGYMAPEQAGGDPRKIGPAADIYSLGVILYELLTGRVPFQGETALGILEQVRTHQPVPPSHLRPSLSVDLDTICLKCLEKEPGKRYASALALAEDLRCFQADEPIQARPIPRWQRLWQSVRRRPARVVWALTGTILVCLTLAGWSSFRAADERARHRAEAKHQRFVQLRNEALIQGLLAPEQGGLFSGTEAAFHLQTAESAAREALALAGLDLDSESADLAPGFPAARRAEVIADCYALLLVRASIRGQQPSLWIASAEGKQGYKEQYREALRLLDHARQLGFQTRAYHLRRAHLLDLFGEQQEARADRNQAAHLAPQGALDHFLIGEELYRRGDWKQAQDSFNQALALQSDHFWAQFFLAVCHLRGRDPDAARAGLNACLAQQPDFVWPYLFRSFAHQMLGSPEEAEADFQKALQRGPNADAQYVLFLSRGIHLFHQGELSRAGADFRSAQALKPEQYSAYLNLAQVHLAQGQFAQAAEQFRAAMPLRPPGAAVAGYHLQRGRALLGSKRYEEALQDCEAARALAPHQPLPDEVRGRALLSLARHAQAEAAFDEYFRKGGEGKSDIFCLRGRARMRLGKYPEAAEDYTRALGRGATADLYQHRGRAHLFSDAFTLAERDFSKAIELAPTAPGAWIGRGWCRLWLGEYQKAFADAAVALHCLRSKEEPHAEPQRRKEERISR